MHVSYTANGDLYAVNGGLRYGYTYTGCRNSVLSGLTYHLTPTYVALALTVIWEERRKFHRNEPLP